MNPEYCTVCNLLLDDAARRNSEKTGIGLCAYIGCRDRIENICSRCAKEILLSSHDALEENYPKQFQLFVDHQEMHRPVDLV